MNQVNMRQRSAGMGQADFASSSKASSTVLFKKLSAEVSSVSSAAVDSIRQNTNSANVAVGNRIKMALLSFVGQTVVGLGTLHVKLASPRPLSGGEQMGLAIACLRQKFPDKPPPNTEVLGLKESAPKVFNAILTILKDTTTGTALACLADIQDFKKAPTLEKADAIISKFIRDPMNDEIFDFSGDDKANNKTESINIYRSNYLEFMSNYDEAKRALAYQESDATEKLKSIFKPIVEGLAGDIHSLSNTIQNRVCDFERK